ncbi:MAG: SUMF1/EgtB/PvdO family nonheme iron enzyme [Verrucomicrobiota bacterium]
MFYIDENPSIPNFEILGRIGGGSYGEVFLAKSVTGALRAVKIVRREDFDLARTFEREFEGIQRYESVSRDHSGLVDVLFVGRDDDAGCYYYVMELADDESGEAPEMIAAEHYRPRTLSSDLKLHRARPVDECVRIGRSLSGALGHLHEAGLAHRDVKPSNIIFVKGQPQLADIGLVARSGQRTFVGTEGYVPPEGPGTSTADLYSLAMVLYELHTGKDRLDFPELPTNLEIPPTVNRDHWRKLNAVVCRAGSPDPRKRYPSAAAFSRALIDVVGGDSDPMSARQKGGWGKWVAALIFLMVFGAAGYGGYWLWKDQQKFFEENRETLSNRPDDSGAEERDNGIAIEGNPADHRSEGEDSESLEPDDEDPAAESDEVITDDAESLAESQTDPEEMTEAPDSEDGNEGEETQEPVEPPADDPPILRAEIVEGSEMEETAEGAANQAITELAVITEPAGAMVYYRGQELGRTSDGPFEVKTGRINLLLRLESYFDEEWVGEVAPGSDVVTIRLRPDRGPILGNPWVNSLDMQMVPEGQGWASRGPVGEELIAQYREATGRSFPLTFLNDAVQISDDAVLWQICDWLTSRDRELGYLDQKYFYGPSRRGEGDLRNSFHLQLNDFFSAIALNSIPAGAVVYRDGERLGRTPLTLSRVRQGPYRYEFHLPGYKMGVLQGSLTEATLAAPQPIVLQQDGSVIFGEAWRNSQAMPMVPVGDVMVAAREVSVQEFRQYLTATGAGVTPQPQFGQALNHPVVSLERAAALDYCDWLTRKERAEGLIRPWQYYRIPFAKERETIVEASGGVPWGEAWPPPAGSANLGDAGAVSYLGENVIAGYEDRFLNTAPVDSFPASPNGIYHLFGNAWEWVLTDPASGIDAEAVMGGGWETVAPEQLTPGFVRLVAPGSSEDAYGFRYVLVEEG